MSHATTFEAQLKYLKLGYTSRHHEELTAEAAKQRWSHAQFLRRLVESEAHDRQQHALLRRIKATRFPVTASPKKPPRNQTPPPAVNITAGGAFFMSDFLSARNR